MARLHVMERSHAQAVMDDLHDALGRRLAVSSLAPCPVEFTAALVNLCSTQSCGKCTPCRVGLSALSDLLTDVLEGRADESTLNLIERTARTIYLSSDCAIGYEAGAMALTAIRGFRDDFEHHIREHSCGFDREARVPCVSGCPAHVDIPGYISLVEAGRYADAVKVIRKNNPLPLVCGLVCEHPCEMHCRRGMVDDPMNILALKRFAVEHSDLNDHKPHVVDNTGKRVAVIGGGPAGLSCAYYLAVMGHKVTIFEQRHHLGGMLRYGIPSYRLPRERLQAEIDWILSAGIDVELDHSVSGEELARLRDEFDAVYLAIGAHSDKKLGLPGEEAPGVESAVKMLRAIGDDELPDLSGQRVCVIGGGNVAMDVARSAVRCGAEKVSIVYRRRICDMTAQDAEIAGAQAEGCEVLELTAPLAIETGEDGRVSGLRVQPQIIGEPRRGRPAPRAAATPERVIPCERVFVAIGQDIDSKPFEDMGIACKWGCVVTDSDGAVPNFDGLFSGGDCQTGPATVIRAINAGRVASANIDRYLGFDHKIKLDVELPTVQFKGKHECGRCELGEREAGERIHDWNLVEQGLTEEEARQEASRCLRCDHFGFGAFRGGRNLEW
ncbi:NAD(P)-binding protein [Collinsella aerofaciens]|uniref:NAD(P)-binding protein n=1 Tax=Collinsella aerofaciens TaxID=74426 RepID=UPI0011059173|nr:NAD(P)-binding protein [Collinsella aerofaciens]MDB1875574.1 NAD(P)-binding protein [Collinsella aerofaciens]MDB1877174.1 NAD(P)-binding protein [Collinsella aerofaciens]